MRESPVASEKIAVDQASRRPVARFSTSASIGTRPVVIGRFRPLARLPIWYHQPPPHCEPNGEIRARGCQALVSNLLRAGSGTIAAPACLRAFPSNAEHQAAEEARPNLRRGPAGQPPLPLDGQDDHAAAGGCRPGRRHRIRSRPSTRRCSGGSTAPRRTARSTRTRPRARRRRPRGSSRAPSPRRRRLPAQRAASRRSALATAPARPRASRRP